MITLEFISICETKSNEESHKENRPFLNQDFEKNAVWRVQRNFQHETRICIFLCYKLDFEKICKYFNQLSSLQFKSVCMLACLRPLVESKQHIFVIYLNI